MEENQDEGDNEATSGDHAGEDSNVQVNVESEVIQSPASGMPASTAKESNGHAVIADERFPGAGALYESSLDLPLLVHVLVGGFNVPEEHAPLYTRIWNRYGHIAVADEDGHERTSIGIVSDLLSSLAKLEVTELSSTPDSLLDSIEKLVKKVAVLDFNLSWLVAEIKSIRLRCSDVSGFTRQLEEKRKEVAAAAEEIQRLTQELEEKSAAFRQLESKLAEGKKPPLDGRL